MRIMMRWTAVCMVLAVCAACAGGPAGPSDEEMARQVYLDKKITSLIFKRFLEDPAIRTLSITPRCYGGRLYLVGEYDSEEQKNRAIAIGRETEGVVSVDTYLLPRSGHTETDDRNDADLSSAVKERITDDGGVSTIRLDVIAVQSNVVLVGIVRTEKEIARASEIAQGAEGVRSVISFLNALR